MSAPLARDWRDQPPAPPTARHCPLCGTFHDELRGCPELVPGYGDSADGRADAADLARWNRAEQRRNGTR
jgi:hypothetical protein